MLSLFHSVKFLLLLRLYPSPLVIKQERKENMTCGYSHGELLFHYCTPADMNQKIFSENICNCY